MTLFQDRLHHVVRFRYDYKLDHVYCAHTKASFACAVVCGILRVCKMTSSRAILRNKTNN
jgi:hypothetical protein